MAPPRPLLTAELLSIGTELTVGETRDTNAGELARSLTGLGVAVRRIQALPDDLDAVRDAFATALGRADLVVSTGGLGPTPDDLTREAIAAVAAEEPVVDRGPRGLAPRALVAPRASPLPAMNLKQAWLIPSATALPNGNGTAPGWWVDRPDGRVIIALPGPPREMRPIWQSEVLPRLRDSRRRRGDGAAERCRLAGIGESAVADILGEPLLRATNPIVATYARQDAVDVRVSASRLGRPGGRRELVDEAATDVRDLLADHVWAEGETTWSEAIGAALAERGWTLAGVEVGDRRERRGAPRRRRRGCGSPRRSPRTRRQRPSTATPTRRPRARPRPPPRRPARPRGSRRSSGTAAMSAAATSAWACGCGPAATIPR